MKTTLYLGTDPSYFPAEGHVIHFPVIDIVPKPIDDPDVKRALDDLSEYTHAIFTSKNTVKIFFSYLAQRKIDPKTLSHISWIAVGKITAHTLEKEGVVPSLVAGEETQEGLVKDLSLLDLDDAYVFFPRSSLSRPVLLDFLLQRGIRHQSCYLYDTKVAKVRHVPDMNLVDEIVFTSPSTVEAFCAIFGSIPHNKKLVVIGPVTEEALKNRVQVKT